MKPRPILVVIGLLIVCGAISLSSEGRGETDRFADKERLSASDLYVDRNTSQRIKELLGDPAGAVRITVIQAAARMTTPQSLALLKRRIHDGDRAVSGEAARLLEYRENGTAK